MSHVQTLSIAATPFLGGGGGAGAALPEPSLGPGDELPEEWLSQREALRRMCRVSLEGVRSPFVLSREGHARLVAMLQETRVLIADDPNDLMRFGYRPYQVSLHLLLQEIVAQCVGYGFGIPEIRLKGGALASLLTQDDYREYFPRDYPISEGAFDSDFSDIDIEIRFSSMDPRVIRGASEVIQTLFFMRTSPSAPRPLFVSRFFMKRFLKQDRRNNWALLTVGAEGGKSIDFMVTNGLLERDHICSRDSFYVELPYGVSVSRKTSYHLHPSDGCRIPLPIALLDRLTHVLRVGDPLSLDPNAFVRICSLRASGYVWSEVQVKELLRMLERHPRCAGEGGSFVGFIDECLKCHPPKHPHEVISWVWALMEAFALNPDHPFFPDVLEKCRSMLAAIPGMEGNPFFLGALSRCLMQVSWEGVEHVRHALVLGSFFAFLFQTVGKEQGDPRLSVGLASHEDRLFFELTHEKGGHFFVPFDLKRALVEVLKIEDPAMKERVWALIGSMVPWCRPLFRHKAEVERGLSISLNDLFDLLGPLTPRSAPECALAWLYLAHLDGRRLHDVVDHVPYIAAAYPDHRGALKVIEDVATPPFAKVFQGIQGLERDAVLKWWMVSLAQSTGPALAVRAWEFYKARGRGELPGEKTVGLIVLRMLADVSIPLAWSLFSQLEREGGSERVTGYRHIRKRFVESRGVWTRPIGVAIREFGKTLPGHLEESYLEQLWNEVVVAFSEGRLEEAKVLVSEMPSVCFASELLPEDTDLLKWVVGELRDRGDVESVARQLRRRALMSLPHDPRGAWAAYEVVSSLRSGEDFQVWDRLLSASVPIEACRLRFQALVLGVEGRNVELEAFFSRLRPVQIASILSLPKEVAEQAAFFDAYLRDLTRRSPTLAHVLLQQGRVYINRERAGSLFCALGRAYLAMGMFHEMFETIQCAHECVIAPQEAEELTEEWLREASRTPALFKHNLTQLLESDWGSSTSHLLRFARCCLAREQGELFTDVMMRVTLPVAAPLVPAVQDLVIGALSREGMSRKSQVALLRKFTPLLVRLECAERLPLMLRAVCCHGLTPALEGVLLPFFEALFLSLEAPGMTRECLLGIQQALVTLLAKMKKRQGPLPFSQDFLSGETVLLNRLAARGLFAEALDLLRLAHAARATPSDQKPIMEQLLREAPQPLLDRFFEQRNRDLEFSVDTVFIAAAWGYLEATEAPFLLRMIAKETLSLEMAAVLFQLAMRRGWRRDAVDLLGVYDRLKGEMPDTEELGQARIALARDLLHERKGDLRGVWRVVQSQLDQVTEAQVPFWTEFFKRVLAKDDKVILAQVTREEFPRITSEQGALIFSALLHATIEAGTSRKEFLSSLVEVWKRLIRERDHRCFVDSGLELTHALVIMFQKTGELAFFELSFQQLMLFETLAGYYQWYDLPFLRALESFLELFSRRDRLPALNHFNPNKLALIFEKFQSPVLREDEAHRKRVRKILEMIGRERRCSSPVRRQAIRTWLYQAQEGDEEIAFPTDTICSALSEEFSILAEGDLPTNFSRKIQLSLCWRAHLMRLERAGMFLLGGLVGAFRDVVKMAGFYFKTLSEDDLDSRVDPSFGGIMSQLEYYSGEFGAQRLMIGEWRQALEESLAQWGSDLSFTIKTNVVYANAHDAWFNGEGSVAVFEEDLPLLSPGEKMGPDEKVALMRFLLKLSWNLQIIESLDQLGAFLGGNLRALFSGKSAVLESPQAKSYYEVTIRGLTRRRVINGYHLQAATEIRALCQQASPEEAFPEWRERVVAILRDRDEKVLALTQREAAAELQRGGPRSFEFTFEVSGRGETAAAHVIQIDEKVHHGGAGRA